MDATVMENVKRARATRNPGIPHHIAVQFRLSIPRSMSPSEMQRHSKQSWGGFVDHMLCQTTETSAHCISWKYRNWIDTHTSRPEGCKAH